MRKGKRMCALLLSALFAGSSVCSNSFAALAEEDVQSETSKQQYTENNLENYSVPEWYRDAKFGIFIHYGVYSVPAFGDEWYGHWMYMKNTLSYGGSNIYQHHLNTYGGASQFGYKDFIPQFVDELKIYSENHMAEQWAELFSKAGAKYVMPVGIHHDSYALYDSDIQTTYNSVNQAGVDYIGDLQEEVKKRGMYFGISNHFAENDWFFDDASGAGTDLAEKNADGSLVYGELYGDGKSKSSEHIHKWYDISMEIIEKYQPDLIYYDFDLVYNEFNKYSDANRYLMLSNFYNLADEWGKEGVVCNYKNGAFTQSQAVLEKEREALNTINPAVWQTDTSIGSKSWGYTTDEVYRDGNEFIGALVDIVSKNGNLLLNVGPKADGTIPQEAQDALLTIGDWLNTYGDAIYETRPWFIYGEGPTNNAGDNYKYTAQDIRFTRSKDSTKLYASALAAPDSDKMVITTLKSGEWDASGIKGISLINGSDRISLDWNQTQEGLVISLPADKEITSAYSVEISFDNTIPGVATLAKDTKQPYDYIEADKITVTSCPADGSEMVVNSGDGAYAKYLLDFEDNNMSSITVQVSPDSEGTLEIRQNDKDGALLASIDIEPSQGTDYVSITRELLAQPGNGNQTICVVWKGNIELNDFKFQVKRGVNSIIQAEDFDEKNGTVQAEGCNDTGGGENLGYVSAGDWVKYSGIDFGDDCKKIILRLAGFGQTIDIRIDSPTGEVIATAGSISTGAWQTYKTYEYSIEQVTGVHDLYITFRGPVNVNWFELSTEALTDSNTGQNPEEQPSESPEDEKNSETSPEDKEEAASDVNATENPPKTGDYTAMIIIALIIIGAAAITVLLRMKTVKKKNSLL